VYDPAHITRPSELDAASWQQLCTDVRVAETAVSGALKPDHVNIAFLGNVVPHLHAWIIPRHASDPRWGRPIWTTSQEEMTGVPMTDPECEELVRVLQRNIPGAV
jgi:diadenosine tetraphosphate (Ap4A) HIT family hydrolase